MDCNHDKRFGVMLLPKRAKGCLACYAEQLVEDLKCSRKRDHDTTEQLIKVARYVAAECGVDQDGKRIEGGDSLADAIIRKIELIELDE